MTQTTFTAYEDNAGGTHISDGQTVWFLGFDYDQSNLGGDLAAWAAGEWEPNEDDGQSPESMDQYEALVNSTECHELDIHTGLRIA